MFTILQNTTFGLTKSDVRWAENNETRPLPELSITQFRDKTIEARNKILEAATPQQRAELLTKIQSLKGGSEANKKWRIEMIQAINRLNAVAPAVVAPATPDAVATMVSKSDQLQISQEGQSLVNGQQEENRSTITKQREAVDTIKKTTGEDIDGLKVDIIMTRLFDLNSDFFKGEITRVSKFQELITVAAYCIRTGESPQTEKEWVKLGYSGQNRFEWGDKAELDVVNGFLKEMMDKPEKRTLLQYISSHAGNNEEAYKRVLRDLSAKKLSSMAQKETSESLSLKDGKVDKSSTNSRIDALIGDDSLWNGLTDRESLKASIMRASKNGKTLDALYQKMTGASIAPDWKDDRSIMAASIQFRDALNFQVAILKAVGSGNSGLDALLQGKTTEFTQKIQQHIQANGEIKVEALGSNLNSTLVNSLSGILGVAIAVTTSGVVTLRARGVEDIKSDDILAALAKNPELKGDEKSILEWVANLFVGRRFKLALGNGDSHDALKERVIGMAKKLQGITKDTAPADITDIGMRQAFLEAKKLGLLDTEVGIVKFQKVILEQVIIKDAVSEKDNARWWASLNPLFLGVHRDGVTVDTFATKASIANTLEAKTTAKEDISLQTLGVETQDGKKFTIPQTMKDPENVIAGDIPVVVESNGKIEPITNSSMEKSFVTTQKPFISLIMNNGAPVFLVSFVESVGASQPGKATLARSSVDLKNTTLDAVSERTREAMNSKFIDNITIRTKYPKLQASIANISDEKAVDTVFAALKKFPELKALYDANVSKTTSEKYTLLLSVLGEFAGDQRYRKIRLYQQTPALLDNKKEIAYLRPILHTIIGGTPRDTLKMTDIQIKNKILGLTMGDIERVTVAPENEKFQNVEMQKLGLSNIEAIRRQYRDLDKNNSVHTQSTRNVSGLGFMMNHQVLGKKVTFSGKSAIAPETKIRDVEPIDVTVNMEKSKFIDSLNTVQLSRIADALGKSGYKNGEVNYTPQDIKGHLSGTAPVSALAAVEAKFFYAQFPNCTNDVLYMEVNTPQGGLHLDTKGVFGTSTVLSDQAVRTNELDAGINPLAALAKNAQDKKTDGKNTDSSTPGNTGGNNDVPGTPGSNPPSTPPVPGGGGRK